MCVVRNFRCDECLAVLSADDYVNVLHAVSCIVHYLYLQLVDRVIMSGWCIVCLLYPHSQAICLASEVRCCAVRQLRSFHADKKVTVTICETGPKFTDDLRTS